MDSSTPDSPWAQSCAAVVRALASEREAGLAEAEARRRLNRDGPNQLESRGETPWWRRLLGQFSDVTVLALLGAAVLALVLGVVDESATSWLERYGDSAAIFSIVALNAAIGFFQEKRAHAALASLKRLTSPTAIVMRDGQRQQVAADQVVVGDIVLLEEGARVPADARLLACEGLHVREAALTGESTSVSKDANAVLDAETPLAERSNMLFLGSHIERGTGSAIVTAVGMCTEMGRIAGLLSEVESETTPLQRQMRAFGQRVVIGCGVMAVVLFVLGMLRLDVPAGYMMLVTVSLAVAAIPEGLPAITTIVLALGVRRMASSSALIRHLDAVETLGSAHVICSDKTGTLTQNRMTARKLWAGGEERDVDSLTDATETSPELRGLLFAARFAPAARAVEGAEGFTATGDPTDVALLELHHRHVKGEVGGHVVQTLPFSSDRKLASVVFEDETGERWLFTHGAPEAVLEKCSDWLVEDTSRPFADGGANGIGHVIERWASGGFRVLALAKRRLPAAKQATVADERGLSLVGLVAVSDPPRPEVRSAIEKASRAGVRTIMITGDHPTTAHAIARELSIAGEESKLVTSAQLAKLNDASLSEQVDEIAVVARATAADKLRIVRALQRQGCVVAMTGDGVNDAPAIKAATIGVAMGQAGTDVTREVADLVLADDNYATIVAAIEEGRAIYANIQRFVAFLFAANAGLVLLVTVGLLLGWPTLLTPTQILWINLITNGLPALALGMEPTPSDAMMSRPRPAGQALLRREHWLAIGLIGAWLAFLGLWLFDDVGAGASVDRARTVVFTALALGPAAYSFSARSSRPIWRIPLFGNRLSLAALAAALSLQTIAVYTPALRPLFDTVPLGATDVLLVAASALSVVVVAELLKLLLSRAVSHA